MSGLQAALDSKHDNIHNYKVKIDRLEDRCECLSGDVPRASSRIANLEYQLKKNTPEENALRESIVVHAKSLLTLANVAEKATVPICEKTIVSHSSECPPKVASLAEEQTRPLVNPIAEIRICKMRSRLGKTARRPNKRQRRHKFDLWMLPGHCRLFDFHFMSLCPLAPVSFTSVVQKRKRMSLTCEGNRVVACMLFTYVLSFFLMVVGPSCVAISFFPH